MSASKKGRKLNTGRTHFKEGNIPWNKGVKKATNSGKTHFKKGEHPHNYKGGVSKTPSYRSLYRRRYKLQRKNVHGSHTYAEWETLKAQYGFRCPCCLKEEPSVKLTVDHIIPVSKGGSDNIENIQPLCVSCNSKKYTKVIPKYICLK